ncbi:MAG: exosortase/archaeosortase family protein [Chitinispirillaceae bacterium]
MTNSTRINIARFTKPLSALALCAGAATIMLGRDLGLLFTTVKNESAYTHIAVIPFISLYFLWSRREHLKTAQGNRIWGTILISTGFALFLFVRNTLSTDPFVPISLKASAVLIVTVGSFILLFGPKAAYHSLFSLLILVFAIPMPASVLSHTITFLQNGSALMVDWILSLTAQVYVRDGLNFHLENISIHIAPECSGIRSTMALIITMAMASQIMLKTWWGKVAAMLMIIPLSLLKNAIRISTITLLAQHVDKSFLTDNFLHKGGGIIFYALVLLLFLPIVLFLSRLEQKQSTSTGVKKSDTRRYSLQSDMEKVNRL